MPRSVALTGATRSELANHLLRDDGQEDVCFAVWRPSTGAERATAIVERLVLPRPGARHVHGTASFESTYFRRAAREAADAGGGVALLHSHPAGRGWQGLSVPDEDTERQHAKRALATTDRPFVGLTMAGDESLSARFWERVARGRYEQRQCANVRVVGHDLAATWDDTLVPPPPTTTPQIRTVSAWSETTQQNWSRLRIAIVGAGTVGAIIAEALARMGATNMVLIDHDTVEELNLDRLLHATRRDALLHRAKVEALARGLRQSATAEHYSMQTSEQSVVEPDGFAAALDADLIFSCVDRPWPRQALNYVAYAHLIPVIDVGVRVSRTLRGNLRNAIWRAHVAAPGRPCLACIGQYEPGHVRLERDGRLDDPDYIAGLPDDSPLRARQNVFAFALGAGSLGMNQFISTTVAPGGIGNVGALLYQMKLGTLERAHGTCSQHCPYQGAIARGDEADADFQPTGIHGAAQDARAHRQAETAKLGVRFGRRADDLGSKAGLLLNRAIARVT
jgi:hypothetical protein